MPSDTLTSISLRDLARELDLPPPEVDVEITGVATIDDAGPGDLTFLANDAYRAALKTSRAGAVLVETAFEGDVPMPVLRAERPRLAFARLIARFHPPKPRTASVHPTAIVPASCTLGARVSIGAYAVLGENVRVGAGTTIHPHAVVYDDVRMGAGCEIHSHATVREGVVLGDRVVLQNGAVIGSDGFGFEPSAGGGFEKVPQVGTVVLGDDVEVQANACVDRSALGATRVGRGTKIDNLAQIAHGCIVGEDTIICGQVGLAGSTHVGNRVMLGGQVGSSGHIRIGDGTQVAAQSGVIQDLEPNAVYGGTPATPMGVALRTAAWLPKLPELARQVKQNTRAIEKLQAPDAD